MTELDSLWLAALEDVIGRAAHEVKNAQNGVHLNVEALRSRSGREGVNARDLSVFATSAADQLESLSAQTESLLFLTRSHRSTGGPVDVATTLKHLATLVVPAARADGGALEIEGTQRPAPTTAQAHAVRLALAAGLLELMKEGGSSRCQLRPSDAQSVGATSEGIVVRFSHESASTCRLNPAVAGAIAEHQIRTEGSGSEFLIAFPAT